MYPELSTRFKLAIEVEPKAHTISFAANHSTTMTSGQENGKVTAQGQTANWLMAGKKQCI